MSCAILQSTFVANEKEILESGHKDLMTSKMIAVSENNVN